MLPMSEEGRKAVIELVLSRNDLIIASQLKEGHPTITRFWMIDPVTFEPVMAKAFKWSRGRKSDDVIAAAIIRAVVLKAKTGADALRINEKDEIEEIELKLAIVETETYWVNNNGTIYSGHGCDSNHRTSLFSNISGGFSHIGNPEEKRRPTYLVVMVDDCATPVVGAWRLEGDVVFDYITQNQSFKVNVPADADRSKKSKKVDIKLSTFINRGVWVETKVDTLGIEALQTLIRNEGRNSPHAMGVPVPTKKKTTTVKIIIDPQRQPA